MRGGVGIVGDIANGVGGYSEGARHDFDRHAALREGVDRHALGVRKLALAGGLDAGEKIDV